MWLDVTEDGTCHAGIDAFLSRALGKIDRISYVWQHGRHRPTAVLTVGGTDLEVVFPNPFLLTNCNLYLRADPSRLTAEPYTGGWLFEGRAGAGDDRRTCCEGADAREWMEQEQRRMNEFLQQQPGTTAAWRPMADCSRPASARQLDRDQLLALFHEFFSPYASGEVEREP